MIKRLMSIYSSEAGSRIFPPAAVSACQHLVQQVAEPVLGIGSVGLTDPPDIS
jgi:hypothetical protein